MILEPRFMGMGLGMSTLIVFISMLFWGWVLGNIGIFLSVPLTMTAIIALKSKPETKWIPAILGSGDAD
jgi:AI-2 transport protein TqsA